jgi:hypothetical protein
MRRFLSFALALLLASPALADGIVLKDALGNQITEASKTNAGVEHPQHVMEGLNGATPTPIVVDGSGNAGVNVQSSVLPTGAANAGNQTATQAVPGSDATKAGAVQGITGGKAVNVNPDNVPDGVTSTGTASSATTLVTFSNTAGYGYLVFGFTAVGVGGTVTVDNAPDGASFTASPAMHRLDVVTLAPAATTANVTTAMAWVVPVTAPAMRIRLSAYTSGTFTVYGTLKRGTFPAMNLGTQTLLTTLTTLTTLTGGGVASGAADSGNPHKVGCKYNSTPVAVANGNRVDCQAEPNGALLTEEGGRTYTHISTNATTTVKGAAGYLHDICINTKGATGNTATMYDNTVGSGTVIGVLDTTSLSGCQEFDIAFGTGLTIVTATGTAPDITVSSR